MKLVGICIIMVLATLSPSVAADLGLITVDSQAEAEFAQLLLGDAYAKIDDRFLALASDEQQELLDKAGVAFQLVIQDADTRSLFLVFPRKREVEQGAIAKLGLSTQLNDIYSLVESSPSAASSLRDEGEFFVLPLDEPQVVHHFSPAVSAHPMAPAEVYPTDTLIDRISRDSIYAYTTRLEAFRTRYVWTDSIDRARDWLVQKFQQFGYTNVTFPSFYWNGGYHYNVKAVKPGYAEPEKLIVVGGHYDSYNTQTDPTVYAPGSDDNASGTVVTMEIARILQNVPLRKTIIFIPFSAEEVGLRGSAAAAAEFKAAGADLEVMFNYDMVGYVEDTYWDFEVSSGTNTAYRQVSIDAGNRLTALDPIAAPPGGSSDHASFSTQGYPVVNNIEADFNFPGWHTNLDLTSRMNFDYFTDVVRMAAASIAIVANAGSPATISGIIDEGDGQSLEVSWTPCFPSYQYYLYYGTSPGAYTDSIIVPLGQCSQIVTGLTDGQQYYFGAYGRPADGYRAISAVEGTETPLIFPRSPVLPKAEPEANYIAISWQRNREADMAFYNVYRKLATETEYYLWQGNVIDTFFHDQQVASNVLYNYRVTAVDQTGHESQFSSEVASYAATFDGGILIVDEFTRDYDQFPDQAKQEAFWDTVFDSTAFVVERVETLNSKLTKSIAGRFSSIFWIDDDVVGKVIDKSDSTLRWYLSHPTNLFVCGYKTVKSWSSFSVPADHLLYTEFKVSSFNYSNLDMFVGARGQDGWPDVQPANNRGLYTLDETAVFTVRPGATVIYTYDSFSDNPNFEGKPCGVAYSGPNGKRVLLSFPLYYLTPESSKALITKAKQYFGEDVVIDTPGDVDASGSVDLLDLSRLVAYMLGDVSSVPNLNGTDVNGSCNLDLSDLTWMITYLIYGVPAPLPGCIVP